MNLVKMVESSRTEAKKIENKYFVRAAGKTVILFEDAELVFSEDQYNAIIRKWKDGQTLLEIAEFYDRDPDEIFLCLFDFARRKGSKLKINFGQIWGETN